MNKSAAACLRSLVLLSAWALGLLGVALPADAQQTYYIYADHLDTPRLISDGNQDIRWRWDNDDPFGGNMADVNPGGLGTFEFNLRFPGQYFDKETNLHYNYFRDYSPEIGRYIEADPLGVVPGASPTPSLPKYLSDHLRSMPISQSVRNRLNHSFAYVENRPLSLIDPLGLYGSNDCSYYQSRCQEVGGVYYCYLAPAVCQNTPEGNWSRCVRQCLQEYDYGYCQSNNCGGGTDVMCVINIHQMCWQECVGGGPPQTYPAQ